MRLDPKLLHPSIHRAIDAYGWGVQSSGKEAKLASAYTSLWFKENGLGCLAYGVASFAAVVGTAFAAKALEFDKPWRVFLALGMMVVLTLWGTFSLFKNSHRLSPQALEMLLPLMDLSETEAAYAEAVVAVHRSGRSSEEIAETMGALNALLDEEARLVENRVRLLGSNDAGMLERLESEREELVRHTESALDPMAKDAYEQSLALLDERIQGLRAAGSGVERIEAHLSLLRQSVFATRDAARRLGAVSSTMGPDLSTDVLRDAVARARAQTTETERALAELRTI